MAVQNKLSVLFGKVSQAGYIIDSYYADKLLTCCSRENDDEVSGLMSSPFVVDMFINATRNTSNTSISVKTFYLKFMAILVKNELFFMKLLHSNTIDSLIKSIDLIKNKDASLKCAYIDVLIGMLSHQSGLGWLKNEKSHEVVFSVCFKKSTVFVLRSAMSFITKYIFTLNNLGDETYLIILFEHILNPLIKNNIHHAETISETEGKLLIQNVEPTLDILTMTLKEYNQLENHELFRNILGKHFTISFYLFSLQNKTRDEQLILKICKVLILTCLTSDSTKFISHEDNKDIDLLVQIPYLYNSLIIKVINKRLYKVLVSLTFECCIYWSKYFSHKCGNTFHYNGKSYDMLEQLVMVAFAPIMQKAFPKTRQDTPLWDYMNDCKGTMTELHTRVSYELKNLLTDGQNDEVYMLAIKHFLLLKDILNDSLASKLYQGLHYLLCNFVPTEELLGGQCKFSLIENSSFVIHLLEAIHMLVKNYNINWHQTYEIAYLYTTLNTALKIQNLPTNMTVMVLKLMNVCISKFLQPNMALLMESKNDGSAIEELGGIIYSKLHDPTWEIRDSVLELLHTCTEISYIKYPHFQKLIVDNQLIRVALALALNDSESYVMASAIKCLKAASKIHEIWDDLEKHDPQVCSKLTNLMIKNDEAVIRKEIANFFREKYTKFENPSEGKLYLYEVMTIASLDEVNWEVQLNSLSFWKIVICDVLANEGMIDGAFPSVTFSKENKKIVTLNEAEIKKRLIKAMVQLSKIGCLKILIETIQAECEVLVLEKAVEVSKFLMDILLKYDVKQIPDIFIKEEEQKFSPIKIETSMDCDTNEVIQGSSDSVIDSILKSSDINLLASICETHVTIHDEPVSCYIRKPPIHYYVNPNKFINTYLNTNFEQLLVEKRKWKAGIRSLSSLLDDVIGCYEIADVNILDCY